MAMANRPSDIAKRMSEQREPDGTFLRETFRLPVEAARSRLARFLVSFRRAVT
jgi:hypothetical protein